MIKRIFVLIVAFVLVGSLAFANPVGRGIKHKNKEMAAELNLTPEQKAQVKDIRMKAKEKIKAIRDDANAQIKAILTAEQNQKLNELHKGKETAPNLSEE